MSLETIWAIALKDLRQFFRDRLLLVFLFSLPMMQLLLLVQATAPGVEEMPVGVLDYDRSAESRAFLALVAAADTLGIKAYPKSWEAGQRAIETGEIMGLIIIPPGMAAALQNPTEDATIQLIVDATSSVAAHIIEGGTQQVVQRFTQQRGAQFAAGVQVASVMLYNPGLLSRPFTIGAQLSMITYEITLAVAALGFTREKEIGTLEQLMVTPVRRYELLLGKAAPPMLLGLANFVALSLLVRYVYDVPMRGSYPLLLFGSLLFVLAEVMWGTMISAIAGTQQQAILIVFIQALTDVALSGFLVPVRDMPGVFRFFAILSPLQHYMSFTRAVMLKGATAVEQWQHLVALALLGAVTSVVASLMISRMLE